MRLARTIISSAVLASLVASSGCAQMNNTQKGALFGGTAGAGLGAIIGHQFGKHSGTGALIGGLAGTATGALIGNGEDERERADRYAQQAAYERGARLQHQRALTNRDVIDLTQQGVSDRIIVSMMSARGTRFDTSSHAIIALQQYGVSDGVLQAMIDREPR